MIKFILMMSVCMTKIYSAEIRARWIGDGLFAAPGSVLSGSVCAAGALTHWYVVIQTENGWYGVEKTHDAKHRFHGPFDNRKKADSACSNNRSNKNISVKERASRVTKSLEEVIDEFQGSSEYRVSFVNMNCKGFAQKVLHFIEGKGDISRFCGILLLEKRPSTNFLNMKVGHNRSQTFDHPVISKVRHKYGGFFYKQRVYVTVKRSCNLAIRDASGDVYSLTCIRTGTHYVDYNSSNPTIVKISW